MKNEFTDWKDVASSYYEKCLALTIILILFIFIVFPNVETKSIRSIERVLEGFDMDLEEIIEKIQPPEVIEKPLVNLTFEEEEMDDDESIITLITTGPSIMDWTDEVLNNNDRLPVTPKVVYFDEAPVFLSQVRPEIPATLKKMGIGGTCVLDIEILSDGKVGVIEVLSTVLSERSEFEDSAIEAIRKWRIQPAKANGNPVAIWVKLPIVFEVK
jgi:TonB family protein